MSYQVFARKYRPRTFDDVLGQDHVVRTLKNALAQGRLAQAYLFVGPRGTGKTSTARILSKALNAPGGPRADFDPDADICREIAEGRSLDVLEIDGASNNSVDQIRDLRETVAYAPARGKFRIYYIDEVHMLTAQAFNALLKTLEEPPAHVKFIFATTEPNKILPTILSRCQRFDLRRIPDSIIAEHLLKIARLEGVNLDPKAAHSIARGAEGGMRDAQSMLDQLVAFCGTTISPDDVLAIFGFTAHETVAQLTDAILKKDPAAAIARLHEQADRGKDLPRFLADLITHFRTLLVHKVDAGISAPAEREFAESVAAQAALVSADRLIALIDQFADVDSRMKWASDKRLYFEIGLIKAIRSLEDVSLSDVIMALHSATLGGREPALSAAQPERPGFDSSAPVVRRTAAPDEGGVPVSPTAPHSELQGQALWDRAMAELRTRRPLLWGFAEHGVFVGERDGDLVLGFAPASRTARESLERPSARTDLETLLSSLTGRRVRLRLETRDDIEPPVSPPPAATPSPPAAEPRIADAAPVAAAVPQSAPRAPGPDELGDDPLIEAALRLFSARIMSVTPAAPAPPV